MREILFRGKTITSKEWIYGDLLQYAGGAQIWENTEQGKFNAQIIPETVGQYTGLCDKNGTRIFEGDILQVEQCGKPGSRPFSIYFGEYIDADSDFDYPCIGFYIKIPDGCCNIGALLTDGFEYEVIGNIHDNPELMEVER